VCETAVPLGWRTSIRGPPESSEPAAWPCLLRTGGQEVAGSNPVNPTRKTAVHKAVFFMGSQVGLLFFLGAFFQAEPIG